MTFPPGLGVRAQGGSVESGKDYTMRHHLPLAAAFAVAVTLAPHAARAQDTYIDTNATVNTALPDRLYIGTLTTNPIAVDLVPGGIVGFNAYAYNNSTFNILGGEVKNNILVTNQARLNITSGKVGGGVEADENALLTLTGGTYDRGVNTRGNAVANISGGAFGGGSGYEVNAAGQSVLNVTGGTFSGRGVATGNGILNVLAGTFAGDLRTTGLASDLTQIATLNLRGGTFGGDLVTSGSNAVLNIYGTNLAFINPVPILGGTQYDLLGNLEDGTNLVGKNLIVTSEGVVNLIPVGSGAAAPEPATLGLMSLAALPLLGLARRRKG